MADEDMIHNNALVNKKKFSKNKEKQFKFNGNFYTCKKYGHRAKDCRSKSNNLTQKHSDAMTATAFNNYCKNSNVWYLDSGATE